jgi:putative hydrolase of the HAD superfamily
MRRVRALCLDLDNTLLDGSGFQESVVRTCERVSASHPALDPTQLLAANGSAWQSYWPQVEERWNLGELSGADVRDEVWRRALRACGCADEAVARLTCETHAQLARESYRLFDDAHELLALAKRARVPIALVTNGSSDTQREKLRELRIEDAFDAIVVSGEVRRAKPDPEVFAFALRGLPFAGPDVWHVGDNLETDVAGAKAAGLTAVWLNRRRRPPAGTAPRPDVELASLASLAEWLPE